MITVESRETENQRQLASIETLLNFVLNNSSEDISPKYLQEVYFAFEPYVLALLKQTILRSSRQILDEEFQENVSVQQEILWNTIIQFNWDRFDSAEHAKKALVSYLKQACGYLIDQSSEFDTESDPDDENLFRSNGLRPTENAVISREMSQELSLCLENWRTQCNDEEILAMAMRYEKGMSLDEIAEETGKTNQSIKKILSNAKGKLVAILKEAGFENIVDLVLSKNNTTAFDSREELLKKRRKIFLKRIDEWKDLLPPKTVPVIVSFYGLNGDDPLYDYQATADVLGISVSLVGTYLSQATRILLGNDNASERSLKRDRGKKLYQYWCQHQEDFSFDQTWIEVFTLHFGEDMSQSQIAEKLGISQQTVSRHIKNILRVIENGQ